MTAMKRTPLPARKGLQVHPLRPSFAASACLAWQHSEQFVCASKCVRFEVCRKAKFTFALSSQPAEKWEWHGWGFLGAAARQHATASRQRHPKCTHSWMPVCRFSPPTFRAGHIGCGSSKSKK